MAAEVVMPKFGLTMVEGTIQRWFKNEGDAISEGEALFEVETEKVLYEVESTASGTVAKLLYGLEAVVPVGLPVAVIAEAGEDVAEVAARYSDGAPAPQAATSPAGSPTPGAGSAAAAPAAAATDGKRAPVTPAARKLAAEHNIDTTSLTGTGPGGRILRSRSAVAVAGGHLGHVFSGFGNDRDRQADRNNRFKAVQQFGNRAASGRFDLIQDFFGFNLKQSFALADGVALVFEPALDCPLDHGKAEFRHDDFGCHTDSLLNRLYSVGPPRSGQAQAMSSLTAATIFCSSGRTNFSIGGL